MKNMVNIISNAKCPVCGHGQFIVTEMIMNHFLTNRDGEVIGGEEADYNARGMCCNCKNVFKMMPTGVGFMPLTKLREILFDYLPYEIDDVDIPKYIENPMKMEE